MAEVPDGDPMTDVAELGVRRALPKVELFRQFFEMPAAEDEGFFREILDVLPTAVYTTNASGQITYFNEAAVALWGYRPELGSSEWCGSWKLFWPDGRPLPHDQCPMAVALREGRPVRGIEAIAERPDGSRVPFMPFPTPLYDASGVLLGAVNMLVDITDRKRAGEYEQRLISIVTSSDDAILSKDLDGTITSWNRGAEQLFGYTAEETVGNSIMMLIPAERRDEEPKILERIGRGERIDHYETIRRRKDGSLVEISLTVSPIKNADGEVIGASKIARDITERRRAQEQQALLLGEMKHRVRNTLATVQAIATQTLRSAASEDRDAFLARLRALAGAHDLLTLERWNEAPIGEVVAGALNAFQGSYGARIVITGPADAVLDAHKSMLLAMTLHELSTNAIKYGALSNESGKVKVSWELTPGGEARHLKFVWQESGGPPVKPPERRGFGSVLIERALQRELTGVEYRFDLGGVACMLELTL
jgi:PAS domain S-box-containing protein